MVFDMARHSKPESTTHTKRVDSLAQIWQVAAECVADLSDAGQDREIWFRGHAQNSYELRPSLLRSVKGLAVEPQLFLHYRALRPELGHWETLFQMQHHSVPTRLLDWTTDLATALYFAL